MVSEEMFENVERWTMDAQTDVQTDAQTDARVTGILLTTHAPSAQVS